MGANSDQTVDLTIDNYTTAGAGSGNTYGYINGIGHAQWHTAAAQVSTLTLSGTFAEGDKIAVSVGDKSIVHTVTAANVAGLLLSTT